MLQFRGWFDDCHTAIEVAKNKDVGGDLVLVGSSMGGWISLRMVLEIPNLIKGLLLIAPAFNYMWKRYLVQPSV
jgi:alpha-beta hydrolase superfamily lysophospholipase